MRQISQSYSALAKKHPSRRSKPACSTCTARGMCSVYAHIKAALSSAGGRLKHASRANGNLPCPYEVIMARAAKKINKYEATWRGAVCTIICLGMRMKPLANAASNAAKSHRNNKPFIIAPLRSKLKLPKARLLLIISRNKVAYAEASRFCQITQHHHPRINQNKYRAIRAK